MLINTLTTETGEKVLLIDQVFDKAWLARLHALCKLPLASSPWIFAEHFDGRPRYLHNETGQEWEELHHFIDLPEFIQPIEKHLGVDLRYNGASMWADLTGFGALTPHKELGGQYMMQVYITDTPHDYAGTTIYNEQKEILVQLPYRDNFAWFFDGMKIMHGRHHDVPSGISRFTLQIWFCHR